LRTVKKSVEKIQFSLKYDKNSGTLFEDHSTFMVSRWTLLRMGNVSETGCRENQSTYFMFHYFFPKIVPFME